MKVSGSKKSFSSERRNEVIFGACSATLYTFLRSSKSHTSSYLVRILFLSFLLYSATFETSKSLDCEKEFAGSAGSSGDFSAVGC